MPFAGIVRTIAANSRSSSVSEQYIGPASPPARGSPRPWPATPGRNPDARPAVPRRIRPIGGNPLRAARGRPEAPRPRPFAGPCMTDSTRGFCAQRAHGARLAQRVEVPEVVVVPELEDRLPREPPRPQGQPLDEPGVGLAELARLRRRAGDRRPHSRHEPVTLDHRRPRPVAEQPRPPVPARPAGDRAGPDQHLHRHRARADQRVGQLLLGPANATERCRP